MAFSTGPGDLIAGCLESDLPNKGEWRGKWSQGRLGVEGQAGVWLPPSRMWAEGSSFSHPPKSLNPHREQLARTYSHPAV